MFCSSCGKTIRHADSVCPHCQAPIGDNRFAENGYTSAQFTIAPGQKVFEALNNYTRTTYTSMDDANQEGGEVDSRTTYRPVYEGASAPESVRRDMRAAVAAPEAEEELPQEEEDTTPTFVPGVPLSQAARETLDELDEELKPEGEIDRSQFKSRPIQSSGRAGISRDVSEYIRQLEDNQGKRAAAPRRKAASPVYDDYAAETDDGFAPVDDEAEQDVFDDIEDDDFEDVGRGSFFSLGNIIKILVALLVIAALVFGVIKWVGYVRGNQSSAPIESVSETLYEEGIAMVKSHVAPEYINEMIAKFTGDGMIAMSSSLDAGKTAVKALMPAEPAANDQTFMDALLTIETNISNAVIMDALAVGSESPTAVADSEARWVIVNNAIAQLEGASSAAELTAVINGQTVTVQQETPAPTMEPTVNYNSLSKGDESKEVLALQNRLYELGYLNDDRDGVFGSKTQTALKKFQEAAGIEATGIADNATQQLIYGDDAPYAPGKATPTPAPTATPAPTPEPTSDAIQPAEMAGANAA